MEKDKDDDSLKLNHVVLDNRKVNIRGIES